MWKVLLLLAFLNVGCEEEEESESVAAEVSAAAFLTPEDLQKGTNLREMTLLEAQQAIEQDDDFYDVNPSEEEGDCLTEELNKITLKAGESSISAETQVDLKTCMQKEFDTDSPGLKVSKATMQVAFSYGCDNGDFSAYDGEKFGDVIDSTEEDTACEDATTLSHLINLKYTLAGTGSLFGRVYETEITGTFAISTAEAEACTANLDGSTTIYDDGCLDISKTVIVRQKLDGETMDSEGVEDFKALAYRGLQMEDGEHRWYKGGSMDVTLNAWTGSVTYSAVDIAPSYILRNGSESISGTVTGPVPSLNVRARRGESTLSFAKTILLGKIAEMKREMYE